MSVSTSESTYKCPCGYEFVQNDTNNYGKLKIVRRLHAKKCEVAKEMNKIIQGAYCGERYYFQNIHKNGSLLFL